MSLADQQGPRGEPISGNVVVHTAESIMDDVGPDTGAENLAAFIARRTDKGSYHEICDSDSDVSLIPDSSRAFQVAVGGHNHHAWGICAATSVRLWFQNEEWDRSCIDRMGARIVAFWRRQGIDPAGARWAFAGEARTRGPLLFCHGDLQPGDRTDAWATHPRRGELDLALLEAIRRHANQEGLTVADIDRLLEAIEDDKRTTIAHVEEVRRALTDVKAHTEHVARVTAAEVVRALSAGGTDGQPVDPDVIATKVADELAARLAP